MDTTPARWFEWSLGLAAVLLGVMTLLKGGATLLLSPSAAGQPPIVSFAVRFHAAAALFYVVAGVGMLLRTQWALVLAIMLAMATTLILGGLGLQYSRGLAHHGTPVWPTALRSGFWIGAAILYARSLLPSVHVALPTPPALPGLEYL